ncbi:hypothetical protein SAMN04488082_102239 [Desulfomicrobium apsheronum]|uniref:Uncharacterized protein n=2 Tax=Desulfomicrobium apsheronum TaxID=52560 RepID=A0A1I3Q9C7_9BACT|nr:hypothetical protein SAMN04488082_102239 [Desulfomicrobium apsheronum]
MKSKMNKFQVFEHPSMARVAVKAGFSWPALILGVFFSSMGCIVWLLFNRLWRFAALWAAILVIFIFLDSTIRTSIHDTSLQSMFQVALFALFFLSSLVPAFKGNAWKAGKFSALGYSHVRTIRASSSHNAMKMVDQEPQVPAEK